ncbi:CTQ-dependent lysine 6-oxidase LodA [Aquimarina sp. RZ0]|uniref:CTQ-dependent lysine 6-oxidase LodA n=1 Tax=Aquimarina sp. RZ0 TaxID=2607730 RepID=UPI0011F2254A|nr:CTQ-dependent lysine 6-oxidase LodA [Aquimarina sp. RZ0]KAA1245169.1 hypothetical protein F0000_13030 [Aquimarina sp. RZ0]
MSLKIIPSVGVARLGNSLGQFCLSPEEIGGLPFEADQCGNKLGTIINFKDESGQVRRQGQPFKIIQEDGTEITLGSSNVTSMEWTVHLANKKAAWYQYSELEGNLLYGEENSYAQRGVPFRNPDETTEETRQKLIVDPGPRTVSGTQQSIDFDQASVPADYPHYSFPNPDVKYGTSIKTLGTLKTDDQGRLIVLGGYGHAGGDQPLESYGGSDTWHDDISDGPVYCTITFNDGTPTETLKAWVIIGSPDFAPEIINISTLSDTMFDVGVRHFDLMPNMYQGTSYNDDYIVNYQRDILPIIQRIGGYQWVANVQSMMAFTSNIFDFSDPSAANQINRENYFSYFRAPNDKSIPQNDQQQGQLFKEDGANFFPMMPLNSGSNSVSNETIVKFLALDETQYFMLGQWAKGCFENNSDYTSLPIRAEDQASVGNCVGLPMCPGIEVTWSLQNREVYESPYIIFDQKGLGGYNSTGLTPSRDECEGGGCQPGDLTKRMACPWQADFFQCTIQPINFTNPDFNKDTKTVVQEIHTKESWADSNQEFEETVTLRSAPTKEPLPPTYYSYWWPPQSPWDVLTGENTLEGQLASHLPAGQQMNYARGINSFVQMVEHWSALAFIRNNNAGNIGFPYFTETERTNELFVYKEVGVGQISGNGDDDATTIPVFFIDDNIERVQQKNLRAKKLVSFLEERAFKKIKVVDAGLGLPKSGTRMRR